MDLIAPEYMTKLEMNEQIGLDENTFIRKVPGGFIYTTKLYNRMERIPVSATSCFVAYNELAVEMLIKSEEMLKQLEDKTTGGSLLGDRK